MFSLKRKKIGPIAIDFGRHAVRLVQVEYSGSEVSLVAAGSREVPAEVQNHPGEMTKWYGEAVRSILSEDSFKGKKCVTAIPGKDLLVQHIRMAKQDPARLAERLGVELEGKLPFSTQGSLLRHIVAGEVYDEASGETKLDVIVMAAPAGAVHRYLQVIQSSRLMIEYVTTESKALMRAVGSMESLAGASGSTMLVDLGYSCTRVLIADGVTMQFGRTIPLCYGTLQRSVMKDRGISAAQADQMIRGYGREADVPAVQGNLAVASDTACSMAVSQHIQILVNELQNCLRYQEMTHPDRPVERVIFLGGQVKNIEFCKALARDLSLPAQIGDPIAGVLEGARRLPESLSEQTIHSDWAVVYGLALAGGQEDKTS